jgi:hypothetical protein
VEIVERGETLSEEDWEEKPECLVVLGSGRVKGCGVELLRDFLQRDRFRPQCPAELYHAMTREFHACGKEFALACRDFGKIVGPICPFDPIREFDKMKLEYGVEDLQVRVEELEAKLGAKRTK